MNYNLLIYADETTLKHVCLIHRAGCPIFYAVNVLGGLICHNDGTRDVFSSVLAVACIFMNLQ